MNKKHILCFGDSNTWGYCAQTGGRYEDDVRWTMQLSHRLGEDCLVIEEGLNGRTTVFEDPLNEGLCGLSMLTPILLSHAPLDLMVLMLGTNDCKQRFAATAFKIKDGLMRLVKKARQTQAWRAEPRILIVAPIVIDRRLYSVLANAQGMGEGCAEKSEQLPELFRAAAEESGCFFLDCNPYVTPAEGDFMHFDLGSNRRFTEAIEEKIGEIML
jgi:lysophospholipase L1-like esterase